ncbi:MAG: hypothetical protein V5A33_02290 [Halobacteriales archaeon]
MTTDTRSEPGEAPADEEGPRRVFTLIADDGNRHVLGNWLQANETYTHVTADGALGAVRFDCCIVDVDRLLEHGTVLRERTSEAAEPLPVLLLVPESRMEDVQHHLQRDHPERWDLVDAVLRTRCRSWNWGSGTTPSVGSSSMRRPSTTSATGSSSGASSSPC